MASVQPNAMPTLNPILRQPLLRAYVKAFGRPVFFKAFVLLQKLSLLGMGRGIAGMLNPQQTGENKALCYALARMSPQGESTRGVPITIFDVGANFGDWTQMAISEIDHERTFRVFAFEPSAYTCTRLAERYRFDQRVTVHQLAFSDQVGTVDLFYPWEGAGGASLCAEVASIQSHAASKSEQVTTSTIDVFCETYDIEGIDFLKLDIEGYELAALQGGWKMISSGTIKFIQLEMGSASICTGTFLRDIWELLSRNYTFHMVLPNGVVQFQYATEFEVFWGASNILLARKAEAA